MLMLIDDEDSIEMLLDDPNSGTIRNETTQALNYWRTRTHFRQSWTEKAL